MRNSDGNRKHTFRIFAKVEDGIEGLQRPAHCQVSQVTDGLHNVSKTGAAGWDCMPPNVSVRLTFHQVLDGELAWCGCRMFTPVVLRRPGGHRQLSMLA